MEKGSYRRMKRKVMSVTLAIILLFTGAYMAYIYFAAPQSPVFWDLAYVHYVDVGQGDAIVIQAENFNVLIDGGQSPAPLLNYLETLNIDAFDYVIATHPHADHIGGLAEVVTRYEVKNFMMPDVVHTTHTFEALVFALEKSDAHVMAAEAGYEFGTEDVRLTVLGPIGEAYENLNDYSIILSMDCGNIRYLFTGDAEYTAEMELMAQGYDLAHQVYKVGHHGSNTSSNEEFLKAVSPELAIISCGADNSYGHPHAQTVNNLVNTGAQVLRTDIHGTIIVYTDGETIAYVTEKDGK